MTMLLGGAADPTQHTSQEILTVQSQTVCTDIVFRKHETLTDHGSGPVHTGNGTQYTAIG